MLLLGALTLLVATVPLLGGRVAHLSTITFRRRWAGVAAVGLQVLILRVFPEGDPDLHALAHLASYGLILTFVAANLRVPGLPLLALGGLLNLLAIAANDGVMPADPQALQSAGVLEVPGEFTNSAALADPHLWFLGDVFAIPSGWPLANVFSVGDLVLCTGAFVLLHRVGRSRVAPLLDRVAMRGWRAAGRVEIVRDNPVFRRLWIAQAVVGHRRLGLPAGRLRRAGRRPGAGVGPGAAADRADRARASSSAWSAGRSSTASRASG